MGEEAGGDGEFDRFSAEDCDSTGEEDERVIDWEVGLPNGEDLTPLFQALVPPELASAFCVTPELPRTALDVHRASQYTISKLRRAAPSAAATAALGSFFPFPSEESETVAFEIDDPAEEGESSVRISRLGPVSPSAALEETEPSVPLPDDPRVDPSARNPKRPRLAWTPQLHKRFIDVVAHLGVKNAVPKTIMQLMNVDGLSRENVASHLQKYRLYLKRMKVPEEPQSPTDHHLFPSIPPVTKSMPEQHMSTSIPYPLPAMMHVPIFGMAPPNMYASPIGMAPGVGHQGDGACHALEKRHFNGAFKRD
ncbi:transcription factor PCL1-like [Canna indica]|uniref:Transcription factor PCL1-like n=1 Tax=Canna indica TaxID=4628 RepID=A0AAQ3KUH2_9LILI|nr:transcription factor PCL1-like [Canna indica]